MYIVHMCECTSRIKKKDVQNYSELYLAAPPPTLQAAFREGWTGDSNL
jgi:hypothetical protein